MKSNMETEDDRREGGGATVSLDTNPHFAFDSISNKAGTSFTMVNIFESLYIPRGFLYSAPKVCVDREDFKLLPPVPACVERPRKKEVAFKMSSG